MPWELNILRYREGEQVPLGDRQSVIDRLAEAFPGRTFSPPPLPPQEALDRMAPETRALFLKPTLWMLYEEDDLSIEFWCSDAAEIGCLFADVRGVGNPLPALRRLCLSPGWTVFDLGEYQRHWRVCSGEELQRRASVDLTAESSPQWDNFNRWLSEVIETSLPEGALDPDKPAAD